MNKMRTAYEELRKEIDETMEMLMKEMWKCSIKDMDTAGFTFALHLIKIVDKTESFMETQVKMMEDQDQKLDKILKVLETAR